MKAPEQSFDKSVNEGVIPAWAQSHQVLLVVGESRFCLNETPSILDVVAKTQLISCGRLVHRHKILGLLKQLTWIEGI